MKKLMKYIYILMINNIPHAHNSRIRGFKKIFLSFIFKSVGENINIRPKIKFASGANISIGNNSGIGEESFLQDIGEIIIKDNVLIGPRVMIFTANHQTNRNACISQQGMIIKRVIIEDDVWIGANSIILPGVTLKKGCVVGAGAVVTKNVEEYNIVGGNPASVIKVRK